MFVGFYYFFDCVVDYYYVVVGVECGFYLCDFVEWLEWL